MIDLNKYKDFVEGVTSSSSGRTTDLVETLNRLEEESGVKMSLLLKGGSRLSFRRRRICRNC